MKLQLQYQIRKYVSQDDIGKYSGPYGTPVCATLLSQGTTQTGLNYATRSKQLRLDIIHVVPTRVLI